MKISVVIPTWRRPGSLAQCLTGLGHQDHSADEVILVVRQGDDETMDYLKTRQLRRTHLNVVTVNQPGLVAALNRGLAEARGDVVAFTDDDTVPRRDWLARIRRHFAEDPLLGGLGGRDWVHPPGPEAATDTVGKLRWYGRVVANHHLGIGRARQVDVLKGANMSFRASALDGVRVDERLRGVSVQLHTEIDVCLAVKRRGWKIVYDPAVSVDHYPAERFEDDSRAGSGTTLEHHVHNETYLVLKWIPWWQRACAVTYWTVVGSRAAPGLALLAERILREADRRAVLHRFTSAQRGRWQGIRTCVSAAAGDEG